VRNTEPVGGGPWTVGHGVCQLFMGCLLLTLGGLQAQDKTSEGFSIPTPGKVFEFPRDHGSHPDFKIEWWYVTGHLFAEDGRRFGFQATYFRQANKNEGAESALFQRQQFHLAHMALLDVKTKRFLHEERLNRGGWDADSNTTTLEVRNGNWSLRLIDPTSNTLALRGSVQGEARFDLELTPAKPLVIFGEHGVSKKAAAASAASYYLTFPRLKTQGILQLGAEKVKITGEAWMDHEISSSQLAEDQSGWDWAALQLKDGREIMVYRLRLKQGGMDPHSTLAWVNEKAEVKHFKPEAFRWEELRYWQSPITQARYPIEVKLHTQDPATGKALSFTLQPLSDAQEQTGSLGGTAYWEGACRVLNEQGEDVGSAFLELAGYTGDLASKFK
jgi:predicted secreted hydrolase